MCKTAIKLSKKKTALIIWISTTKQHVHIYNHVIFICCWAGMHDEDDDVQSTTKLVAELQANQYIDWKLIICDSLTKFTSMILCGIIFFGKISPLSLYCASVWVHHKCISLPDGSWIWPARAQTDPLNTLRSNLWARDVPNVAQWFNIVIIFQKNFLCVCGWHNCSLSLSFQMHFNSKQYWLIEVHRRHVDTTHLLYFNFMYFNNYEHFYFKHLICMLNLLLRIFGDFFSCKLMIL